MIVGGVWLEDRLVRELAPLVERPLGRRLEQALLFRAQVVALTREERASVLFALDQAPGQLDEYGNCCWQTKTGVTATGGSDRRRFDG